MARFDEIELQPVIFDIPEAPPARVVLSNAIPLPAYRFRRILALLTDLSLFVALALALSPLLPPSMSWPTVVALGAFVVLMSFYYFVGAWLLWGKTIGGTIFDVKVIAANYAAMTFKNATQRWAGLYLTVASGGIGFLLAALPSRLSLADRLSSTRCVRTQLSD
jgi:uncharacterized RDD family membrane protein YckC